MKSSTTTTRSIDDGYLIDEAFANAEAAGYPGLKTARKFFEQAGKSGLLEKVEKRYGKVAQCWATWQEPGTPGIPAHAHHKDTVVYFPQDHDRGLWVQDYDEAIEHPALRGHHVFMRRNTQHWVDPNDTDECRATIVFTLGW